MSPCLYLVIKANVVQNLTKVTTQRDNNILISEEYFYLFEGKMITKVLIATPGVIQQSPTSLPYNMSI